MHILTLLLFSLLLPHVGKHPNRHSDCTLQNARALTPAKYICEGYYIQPHFTDEETES